MYDVCKHLEVLAMRAMNICIQLEQCGHNHGFTVFSCQSADSLSFVPELMFHLIEIVEKYNKHKQLFTLIMPTLRLACDELMALVRCPNFCVGRHTISY